MADNDGKVRIIIDTNAKEASRVLDETSKSFDNTGKSAERAKTVFDAFQNEVNENISSLREMALAGGQNSDEFKKLAQATRETQKQIDLANKAVNDATGGLARQSNGMTGVVSAATRLVGGYVGLQGAIKAFNFAMESVDAFRVQERAILSLNTTLANAGVYTAQYSDHLQKLATDIQSFSNYGDEAVIKAVSIGQAFIGQTKITDDLIKSVTDFAAAMSMDLEQAFTLVGKSIGSDTNALARYGIELKKGMSDSEKMSAITKQLGDRYKGQAEQMADANIQLKNSIGDLKEAFGGILNGYVTNWQSGMSKMVQATTRFINSIKTMNAAVSSLSTSELEERYKKNADYLRTNQQLFERTIKNPAKLNSYAVKEYTRIKAENAQILEQIKYIRNTGKTANNTPIKMQDEISPNFSQPASFKSSGGVAKSDIAKRSASVQRVKDDYEKLQEAVQNARREVELTAIKYGTSSDEVRLKFQAFRTETEKLQAINQIFDVQKIEQPKTKLQELNEEIQETTTKLQELYLTEGQSQNFFNTKNKLAELQTEVRNMNTAVTNNIGLDWKQIGDSIKSNLSSAILTPLREGESAFDRLGSIGLNVVQMIGQKIIENLLEQISLEQTLNALRAVGRGLSSIFSFGSVGTMAIAGVTAANGKVFENGKVLPFAKGGVVNQPTLFPMANGGTGLMGEAGAEAVMPLRRMSNGRLGVEADTDSQKGQVVNIYNYSGASVETRKRDDNSIDVFIRRVNDALANERTASGFRAAYSREDMKGLQAV